MKKILTRSQYLENLNSRNYNKYTKINEAFANDVNWGDSWVGKMINSIVRKVKIKFNLKRIDSLSKRLGELFDEMVETSKIDAPTGLVQFLRISSLLGTLIDSIENEEDVDKILSDLFELENNVKSCPLEDKDTLLEKIEEFKKFLEGIKKEGGGDVDDEEGSDEEGSDEEGSNEGGDEEVKIDEGDKNNPKTIFFNNSKKLLKSILDIHMMIKNNEVRFQQDIDGKKVNVGLQFDNDKFQNLLKTYNQSKPENKLSILRQLVPMIEKGLDSYKAQNKKDKITEFDNLFKKYAGELSGMEREGLDKNKKTPSIEQNQTKKVGESLIFEEISNLEGDKVKPDGKKVEGETHARNAWKKVVDAYNKSGISKFVPQIEELLSLSVKDKKQTTTNIFTVCKQVVNNKSTVGKPIAFSELIKEGVYDNDLPKAISLFGRILLSFNEDLGLTGAYPAKGVDKVNPIKVFVESFNQLEKTLPNLNKKSPSETKTEYKVGDVIKYKLKNGGEGEKEITKIEGDKFFFKSKSGEELSSLIKNIVSKVEKKEPDKEPEEKKESRLMRYSIFRKINEAVYSESIAEKFNEIFTIEIQEKFQLSEAEQGKIEKMGKFSDKIVLSNADPIIEIVRLFQRAWRLHTTAMIPSGRTGGKVSMSVFLEYEYMGSSSPGTAETPGSGPYRNIEMYEKWNDAVWDVLSNTKYKTTIFSDDATFSWEYEGREKEALISKRQVTGSSTFDNYSFSGKGKLILEAEEGEDKDEVKAKPLGKILLRFITKLLNDSSMYNTGSGSSESGNNLQQFLNEYFGLTNDAIKKLGGLNYTGFNDAEKNAVVTEGMKPQTAIKFLQFRQVKPDIGNDYLKQIEDPKGIVLKIKVGDNYKFLYLLKRSPDKNTIHFLAMDQFGIDISGIRSNSPSTAPKKPNEVEVWKFTTTDRITKDMEFSVQSKLVFKEGRAQDPPSVWKTEKYKPEEVLLLGDEKEFTLFNGATINVLLNNRGLKEKINKSQSGLIG